MWEITLIGQSKDYVHFLVLEENLKSTLKDVIVAISPGENLLCSIAVSDRKSIGFVKTNILETIIKICKEEYLKENIQGLGSDKELNNFIIMSLTILNLQEEIDFARVKVRFTKQLHVRSLVRFRLNRLYLMWERFVNLFNMSIKNSMTDEVYLEFLKFLAINSTSKEDVMYLEERKNNICIYDKNKNLMSLSPKNDEIGIVVNLIMFSPKKLIINCLDCLSSKVAGLIKYIFEDRVSVLM